MDQFLGLSPAIASTLFAIAILLVVTTVVIVTRKRKIPTELGKALDEATLTALDVPSRLATAQQAMGAKIASLFARGLTDDVWQRLEEVLLTADLGLACTTTAVDAVKGTNPNDPSEAEAALNAELRSTLADKDRSITKNRNPSVIVVVGVNGVGKTTTIAKLAARLKEAGATPVLAAADTFRAAADKQLAVWADRVGVEVVRGSEGADPASVAYQGVARAKEAGFDTVIVDTAGRLHSKKNLMQELDKIVRVLEREAGGIDEALLVIDGTAGQNGMAQARAFAESVDLTGIVLTKMDGSAKGGIAFAVEAELNIPIKFIGLGEGVDDLIAFDPDAYVDALLS
jgi:fused signal recognition particle receptor